MTLRLQPRLAPPGSARLWVGAWPRSEPPRLTWSLSGSNEPPAPIRAIAEIRTPAMIPRPDSPRAFAGIYELRGLDDGRARRIVVGDQEGETDTLDLRAVPRAVPERDDTLRVLLLSCYDRGRDKDGLAGRRVLGALGKETLRPHLTLLLGDQVYLDQPLGRNFRKDRAWLAAEFERSYARNWIEPGSFASILGLAPSVSIPDDHEYWNNFPYPTLIAPDTLTALGRAFWTDAARAMYAGFQAPEARLDPAPTTLVVEPLAFFLADARTFRSGGSSPRAFHPDTLARLASWVDETVQAGRFGVFATGQPVLEDPAGNIAGKVADAHLANFVDYAPVVRELARLVRQGRRDALVVSGDVHWGRLARADAVEGESGSIHEIISSPTTLVAGGALDALQRLRSALGHPFGPRSDWPRHADPEPPPDFLGADVLGSAFRCAPVHGQKGDQFVVLSFRGTSARVEVEVAYHPIHERLTEPSILTGAVTLFARSRGAR